MDSAWQLKDGKASLETSLGTVHFDSAQASQGLAISDSPLQLTHFFSFLVNDLPCDLYCRENDLVVKYPPRESDLVGYEVRYQYSEERDGFDCVLSAHTQLLESAPQTKVTATLGEGEILKQHAIEQARQAKIPYYLVRPQDAEVSWMVKVHGTDFYRNAVDSEADQPTISFWVFPESLEKGVIRRARFWLRWFPRENDLQLAKDCFDRLHAEEVPLGA